VVILTLLALPLLVGMSFYAGFEETFTLGGDVLDALVAYAVGIVTATIVLPLLGIIDLSMSPREMVGMIALQAIPGSIGAVLARNQLGASERQEERRRRRAQYAGQLFLMTIGAVFFSISLAATEEMVILAYKMSAWHALTLVAVTLALMQAFLLGSRSRRREMARATWGHVLLRFAVTGYAIALVIAALMLWSYGRLDGLSISASFKAAVVLGFPAAVGAAASRVFL
jgi:putative integral membrane protein (TIGR02587 family)